jgi:MFS family permease
LAYAASFAARADLVIVALFLSLWVQTAAIADGATAAEASSRQGALFGIVQGSAMLWAPLFGWMADKVNRVTLVIIATVLSVVGYGWMGFTPDPAMGGAAFGAAAMLGIGQASGILASQVLIAQEAPFEVLSSAWWVSLVRSEFWRYPKSAAIPSTNGDLARLSSSWQALTSCFCCLLSGCVPAAKSAPR